MAGLHRVIRDTKRALYCGPTAICAVTGLPASRVLSAIEIGRGEGARNAAGLPKGVRGMTIGEVSLALRRLGFITCRWEVEGEPTFAAYLDDLQANPLATAMRIARIRGHFLAVGPHGRDVCDTKTLQPVPAKRAPNRRARVTDEILVWPKKAVTP
jgi:hypothetical protein